MNGRGRPQRPQPRRLGSQALQENLKRGRVRTGHVEVAVLLDHVVQDVDPRGVIRRARHQPGHRPGKERHGEEKLFLRGPERFQAQAAVGEFREVRVLVETGPGDDLVGPRPGLRCAGGLGFGGRIAHISAVLMFQGASEGAKPAP